EGPGRGGGAGARHTPVYVAGAATPLGGIIPEPPKKPGPGSPPPEAPVRSSLDRPSLAMIANTGGGEYLELDREGDREIANRIIDAARKRAGSRGLQEESDELYWRCLVVAAALLCVGVLFLQERVELWLRPGAAVPALAFVWALTR